MMPVEAACLVHSTIIDLVEGVRSRRKISNDKARDFAMSSIDKLCVSCLNKLVANESLFLVETVPDHFRYKLVNYLLETELPLEAYKERVIGYNFSKLFVRELVEWARYGQRSHQIKVAAIPLENSKRD